MSDATPTTVEIAPAVIVTRLLDHLADLYAQRRTAGAAIDEQIAALEAQRKDVTADMDAAISIIEEQVKALVSDMGVTIKAGTLMAAYTKPRVAWDTKLFDGYAAAHPEILPFRHVGQASVSIREVR